MYIHVHVLRGAPTDEVTRKNAMAKDWYFIGRWMFSLGDIQHGILRRKIMSFILSCFSECSS